MANIPVNGEETAMYQDLSFGERLREWRQRRRMSQLDLAAEAELSTRHLSFVETGRSRPSRETVLRLAEALELPLRSRNELLIAAGFAPSYPERPFGDAALENAREVVQRILDAHLPFPALAVDRHWHLVAHNAAVAPLMAGAAPHLLEPPVNVLRLSLHPEGLASSIANLTDWKRHILDRLRHQIAESGDRALEELFEELRAFPAPASKSPAPATGEVPIAVPMVLDSPVGRLSFISTTTVFGTPVEVTLSELAIESFFPADEETAMRLRQLAHLS
jgi:transcriptional regulator with XRE-family HTH domain